MELAGFDVPVFQQLGSDSGHPTNRAQLLLEILWPTRQR
jgi:hypothetical protein